MERIRVAVAYHSGYGKTARLASAVARGASKVPDVDAHLVEVSSIDAAGWAALDAAHAIVFGAPTYFGSVSAEMKRFLESTVDRWVDGPRWRDKLAAGFTNSKTMSGDKLNTLFDLAAFAAQHGMIWVGLDLYPGWHTRDPSASNVRALPASRVAAEISGRDGRDDLNRLGSWFGVMSQANSDESPDDAPPASDLATGSHLGRRVAELTRTFVRGASASTGSEPALAATGSLATAPAG